MSLSRTRSSSATQLDGRDHSATWRDNRDQYSPRRHRDDSTRFGHFSGPRDNTDRWRRDDAALITPGPSSSHVRTDLRSDYSSDKSRSLRTNTTTNNNDEDNDYDDDDDDDITSSDASVLRCLVPLYDKDYLWNPAGDLFTIRPIDSLRKMYDELCLSLRWFIVGNLASDRANGNKKLYFSANEHTIDLKTGDKAAILVAYTPHAAAKTALFTHLPDLSRPTNVFCRTLNEFFSRNVSWDCDKLLAHIKKAKFYYGERASTAAQNLFKLRNAVFHRSFLAGHAEQHRTNQPPVYELNRLHVGGDSGRAVLHYTIDAMGFFLSQYRDLTRDSFNHAPQWRTEFLTHDKQVRSFRIIHRYWRRLAGLDASDDVTSNDTSIVTPHRLDDFIDSIVRPGEWEKALFDITLTFGTRFASATPTSSQSHIVRHGHEKLRSIFGYQQILRFDLKNDKVTTQPITLADPLGVTHADVLWRSLDAFAVMLHDVLFVDLWDKDTLARPYLVGDLPKLTSVTLCGWESTNTFTVFEQSKDGGGNNIRMDLDSSQPNLQYYYDPETLMIRARSSLTHLTFSEQSTQSRCAREQIMQKLANLIQMRQKLSHQHFIKDPRSFKTDDVRTAIHQMIDIFKYLLKKIHRASFDQALDRYNSKAAWQILNHMNAALDNSKQEATYSQFRVKQKLTVDQFEEFASVAEGSTKLMMEALRDCTDHGMRSVASSLLGRFKWHTSISTNRFNIIQEEDEGEEKSDVSIGEGTTAISQQCPDNSQSSPPESITPSPS